MVTVNADPLALSAPGAQGYTVEQAVITDLILPEVDRRHRRPELHPDRFVGRCPASGSDLRCGKPHAVRLADRGVDHHPDPTR